MTKPETGIPKLVAHEKSGFNSIEYNRIRSRQKYRDAHPKFCTFCGDRVEGGGTIHQRCIEAKGRIKLRKAGKL